MARLLITGGAGFIGVNFVYYWAEKHPEDLIVVLDALTYAGNLPSLEPLISKGKIEFIKGDIGDQNVVETLLRDHQIDTLVNFAAESHVDRSITGPDAFIETNIMGTHSLLKAARQVWLVEQKREDHRFHHISTDEVFGSLESDDPAFSESHQYQPNSPYSASKAASDHLVRAYHHTFGLKVTTSNCSNNYGPYHFPEKLIPLCITNLLQGKKLPIYGDGQNIRDWLYVEDHCIGIDLILQNGKIGETYNIGGVNEWDNLSLVKLLCKKMDEFFANDASLKAQYPDSFPALGQSCESALEFVTDRAGHDRRYAIDADKIVDELGYSPSVTFDEGLVKTIDWFLNNEEWWTPLLIKR